MLPRTTRSIPSNREKQRERERTARQRRAANLETMRVTHNSLQAAVLAVHTLDDHVWERFLNPDALRMRNFLKASLQLGEEEAALREEQAQLRRQLMQHQLSTQTVAQMIHDNQEMDRWEYKLDRLQALQRQHYQLWTRQECQEEIDKALKVINAFEWSTEKQTTGVSFLGWREYRRMDSTRNVLQFHFHKTFRGYDVMDFVNAMWDAYTDSRTCQQVILGPRIIGTLDIMQQLGPNTVIIRLAERIPKIGSDVHIVYLLYRLRTERGFLQFVRTICCPEFMKATELEWPNDRWPSNFIWFEWELLDHGEKGFHYRVGGSMGYSGINYANLWMWEAFGCVLRSEQAGTRRLSIKSEHS